MVSVGLLHEKEDDKKMLLLGSKFSVKYCVSGTIIRRYGMLLDLNKKCILFRCLDKYDNVLHDVCICLSDIIDIKLSD